MYPYLLTRHPTHPHPPTPPHYLLTPSHPHTLTPSHPHTLPSLGKLILQETEAVIGY